MEVSQRISASGLLANQRALDAISNNLANVNTSGFKRAHAHTLDLGYQAELIAPVGPDGSDTRLIGVGQGTQVQDISHDFVPGTLQPTGQPLDVALDGDGYLTVQLPDGQTGYTRDGNLQLDGSGNLLTPDGLPVLDANGAPLQVPAGASNVRIQEDGQLWASVGGADQAIGSLGLATFMNNGGLQANGQNVWLATPQSGPATPVAVGGPNAPGIVPAALEGSNVDMADEFTRMIQAQRGYQLNAKLVSDWDTLAATANQIVR